MCMYVQIYKYILLCSFYTPFLFAIKNLHTQIGEMSQQLDTLAVMPDNLSSLQKSAWFL